MTHPHDTFAYRLGAVIGHTANLLGAGPWSRRLALRVYLRLTSSRPR